MIVYTHFLPPVSSEVNQRTLKVSESKAIGQFKTLSKSKSRQN